MARESASMEGVIDSIIYKNEENGYTIARALLDDGGELTLVGTIPFLGAGEHISATGTVTLHPQHGPQFQVESYYREMPQTEEDIYLAPRALRSWPPGRRSWLRSGASPCPGPGRSRGSSSA